MLQTEKYLPKTANALKELKECATLLDETVTLSLTEKKELTDKLVNMRQTLKDKAECIDNIINTLYGALK